MRSRHRVFRSSVFSRRALVSTVLFGAGACGDTQAFDSSLSAAALSPGEAERPAESAPAPAERRPDEAPDASAGEDPTGARPEPGRKLGRFRLTYYWAAVERPDEPENRLLRAPSCRKLTRVSRRFARRLRMEGTGVLEDGRVINIAGNCECGKTCFAIAEGSWGIGTRNRQLSPFRSIAVDRRRIRVGSWVYVPELDGLRMPGRGSWGGYVHDGCLVADDVGGGVRGRHLDFFAARKGYYEALHDKHEITRVTVFRDGGRCAEHRTQEGRQAEGSRSYS